MIPNASARPASSDRVALLACAVIFHAAQRPDRVLPSPNDIRGNRYRFAREFQNGGISGFWWGVYRNTALERAPAQ